MATYKVFIRRWYKDHPTEKGKVVPGLGKKTTIGSANTEEDARKQCDAYNSTHNPGKYSLKAEYERN